MLPPKTCFNLTSGLASPSKVLYLRLPEDLAREIIADGSVPLRLQLDSADPSQNKLLVGEGLGLPLTLAPETQIVDVARSSIRKSSVQIVGRVAEKLSVKQELVKDKAAAVRAQSELAEKERLSRRTMTIDEPIKNNGSVSKVRSAGMSASQQSSRNRLLQRVQGGKKVATVGSISSPRITKPTVSYNERLDKSSTHSWSPPIDVFSKPAEPAAPVEPSRPTKVKKATQPKAAPIESQVIHSPDYDALLRKYQGQVNHYTKLEQYMDRRLAIFEQLQKDLTMAADNPGATERISNRVAIETNALNADKEYKWKLAEMNQLRTELETIKSQLDSLSA